MKGVFRFWDSHSNRDNHLLNVYVICTHNNKRFGFTGYVNKAELTKFRKYVGEHTRMIQRKIEDIPRNRAQDNMRYQVIEVRGVRLYERTKSNKKAFNEFYTLLKAQSREERRLTGKL